MANAITAIPYKQEDVVKSKKTQRLESIPYKGDDLAQRMAKTMWLPMLAMGLMATVAGLAIAIASGVSTADFFGGGTIDELGSGEALKEIGLGTTFLGMAFILSSVTMSLVNIIRTLRDTGKDIQTSVRASQITQLKKPLSGKLIPPVMMMGLMIVMVGAILAYVQANLVGSIDPQGLQDQSVLSSHDLANLGSAEALDKWLPPFKIFGLALIFVSIILALRTITKTIRFQSQRVIELAKEKGVV